MDDIRIDKLIEALSILNKHNPAESENIVSVLTENVNDVCYVMEVDFEKVDELLFDMKKYDLISNGNTISKYLVLNTYFICKLLNELHRFAAEVAFSISQSKELKLIFKNFLTIGINFNLLKSMPEFIECKSQCFYDDDYKTNCYNKMLFTTHSYLLFIKSEKLNQYFLPFFDTVLNAMYQIIYYLTFKSEKIKSEEKLKLLQQDVMYFDDNMGMLEKFVTKNRLVKSTMLLMQKNPVGSKGWLVQGINQNLTRIIKSDNGIVSIARALRTEDYDDTDTTKNWRIIQLMMKLVLRLSPGEDFITKIVPQVISLLSLNENLFDNIFIAMLKAGDYSLFINTLLNPLITYRKRVNQAEVFKRAVILLHKAFIREDPISKTLESKLLKPIAVFILQLIISTRDASHFKDMRGQLVEIFSYFLKDNAVEFFDTVIALAPTKIPVNKCEVVIRDKKIFVCGTKCKLPLLYQTIDFVDGNTELSVEICNYSLKILLEVEQDDLQTCPEEKSKMMAKKGAALEVLGRLLASPGVCSIINQNPIMLFPYMYAYIDKFIESKQYITKDKEVDLQIIFTMINILSRYSTFGDIIGFDSFPEKLEKIKNETDNDELKTEVTHLLDIIKNTQTKKVENVTNGTELKNLSEFEKAILEAEDPLLPVRGAGLRNLAILVENKDPEAMERKMVLLNLFQQQLNEEDSYIYLSAIRGLTAMGDWFPDLVIPILTEEFIDFQRNNSDVNIKLRLKIGEVLVKATRNLGHNAVKYKSDLVNTFLLAAKDDDFLIRTSSISNLGQVCLVIGSELGPILNEIVKCVFTIMVQDAAMEPRRAAVEAFKNIFLGLKEDSIKVLENSVGNIWKTLIDICSNGCDTALQLHAQQAIEELNTILPLIAKKYTFSRLEKILN